MKIHKFKPLRKRDTLLFKLLIAVGAIHAIALLIFGGIVISEIILEPETTFEAPPPPEKVEKKQQFQYKPKQQQQQSASKLVKRIQIPPAKMQNVSTANIALPSSDIAGTSLMGGFAPKGLGDMKITMTSVNLRGIQGKTEKIIIIIDASFYMMTDEKGALSTYNVIKDDIKGLVNSLPATVLFNVIAFAIPPNPLDVNIAINAFNPEGLLPASVANKEKLMEWLDPINKSLDDVNKLKNNYKLKTEFLPQAPDTRRSKGGYNPKVARLYRPYHAAVEQGADTIYILSADWVDPSVVKRPWTEAEQEAFDRDVAKAKAAHSAKWPPEKAAEAQANLSKQIAERAASNKKALAVAQAWIDKENAKRKAAGQSLYVSTAQQVSEKNGTWNKVPLNRSHIFKPPAQDANKSYTGQDIIKYYASLVRKEFGDKAKVPSVNMILFKGKNENIGAQTRNAEAWTRLHKGKVKVLVGTEL